MYHFIDNIKRLQVLVISIVLLLMVVACSNNADQDTSEANDNEATSNEQVDSNDNETESEAFSPEPVTLTVAAPWPEDMFAWRVKEPVEEALDWVTLELIEANMSTHEDLEELLAAGVNPDIILAHGGQAPLEYLDLDFGLDELIEKHQFDLTQLPEGIVNSMRARDAEGRFIGMPQETAYYGLYYNTDIFDMFGVSYPESGITWEETVNLARDLTQEEDGVDYHGLYLEAPFPLWQLSANMTDPETGEPQLLDNPAFERYFDLMDQIYSIPGNYQEEVHEEDGQLRTAMVVSWHGYLEWWGDVGLQESVEILPTPVWSDLPNIGPSPEPDTHPFTINPHSEHLDEAFQVLVHLVSEEYQMMLARNGTGSVLMDNPAVIDEYAVDHDRLADKNIEAFFELEPATPPETVSRWDSYVNMGEILDEFYESEADTVEFLREAEQKVEREVEEVQIHQ